MSDLAQSCADLAAWYPLTAALTAVPDTEPSPARGAPGSRPPWNPAAAAAWTDIHAFARAAERAARRALTGTVLPRGGSDANTIRALEAAARLIEAIPEEHDPYREDANGKPVPCQCPHHRVQRRADQLITAAMTLPAVDLARPWRHIPAACPRCSRPMLRYQLADPGRPGKIACLGCGSRGLVMPGTVSYGIVEWDDQVIT